MRALLLALAALFVLVAPVTAHAHAMRSVLVEIDEVEAGRASVHVRSSVPDSRISIGADAGCVLSGAVVTEGEGQPDRTGTIACADGTLAGHVLSVKGLGPVVTEGVLWARYADGWTSSHLATRDAASWELPVRASGWSTTRQYIGLGVVHILTGYDHLLFLVLLVLTLRSVRAVLAAESAFTLSHSISFTATALGWVRVSSLGAEACIAISLVLVALDVQRTREASRSLRGAAALAFLFGLVHGLGFAGGLREIGLPDRDVALALASFGGGVEIGQVAFLAVVLAIVHFARRSSVWPRIELAGAYVGGTVASFWVIERVTAIF